MDDTAPDFVRMDQADVYKGETLAGRLRRHDGRITFRYDEGYPAELPEVATTLPRTADGITVTGGAVPAFFAGLLPEGRRLTGVVRALKTSADDELSILLAVGNDLIGDVRVVPHGEKPVEPGRTKAHGPLMFRELLERSYGENALDENRAIPGVQGKISNTMISFPTTAIGRAPGILKLNPPDTERLVENEAFFLGLARRVGLSTPKWELVTDDTGETGLLVRRFDRSGPTRAPVRIAQEDSVQLRNRWPSDKYRLSSREVFDAVFAVAAARAATTRQLVAQFAFCYLIGNGDLHGKNVSVHSPHPETWELTPAYDLVSTLPYGDRELALEFEGRKSNLRGGDLLAMAERFGLRRALGIRTISELIDRFLPEVDDFGGIGFDDRRTEDMMRASRARADDLRRDLS